MKLPVRIAESRSPRAFQLSSVYDTLQEQIGYETTRGDASRMWLVGGSSSSQSRLASASY
ncbi:hypothetical protein ACFWAY_52140 [Rhodococcus sp. NPDC059968]|uniref:hypothetical protein n=1 Tax=Rhodococcus sp. NPDC059968 TaxID=3347017 RepID=UPI00366DE772